MTDVVCGVIENAAGEFLACLRPAGEYLAGHWELPGGKVEPGESPEMALARELMEELTVVVEVGLPLSAVTWYYGDRTVRLRPFYCRITGGELRAMVHEKLHWCAPENFQQLDWAPADIPILGEIALTRR